MNHQELGADAWTNAVMSALGFLVCAAFVVIYHLRAPWWKSEVGRNQMSFAAAIGLLCLYTVLATVWQADECVLAVLRSIRSVAVGAVIVLMVQRIRLLLKAQRESSRQHDRTGV